jgi:hypothetical protein
MFRCLSLPAVGGWVAKGHGWRWFGSIRRGETIINNGQSGEAGCTWVNLFARTEHCSTQQPPAMDSFMVENQWVFMNIGKIGSIYFYWFEFENLKF